VTYTFSDIVKFAANYKIKQCEVTNHPVLGTVSFTPTVPQFPPRLSDYLSIGVPYSAIPDRVGNSINKKYNHPPQNDSIHVGVGIGISKTEVKSIVSESDHIHVIITHGKDGDIIYRITI